MSQSHDKPVFLPIHSFCYILTIGPRDPTLEKELKFWKNLEIEKGTVKNVQAIIEIACQSRGWYNKGNVISFIRNLTLKRLSLTLEFVLFPQNFLELPLSDTVNFLRVLYLRKQYYHSFCRRLSLQGRGWTYFNISTKHFCRVRINSSKKTINIILHWGCLLTPLVHRSFGVLYVVILNMWWR